MWPSRSDVSPEHSYWRVLSKKGWGNGVGGPRLGVKDPGGSVRPGYRQ